jgi:RNA recognition motif. (a.k.a. RRM, RBD, or RNP domain)
MTFRPESASASPNFHDNRHAFIENEPLSLLNSPIHDPIKCATTAKEERFKSRFFPHTSMDSLSNALEIIDLGYQSPVTSTPRPFKFYSSHGFGASPQLQSILSAACLMVPPNSDGASATPIPFKPVLKMTNIPWEISSSDIQIFLMPFQIPLDCIHIPIDRITGKTRNEAFVEMSSYEDLIDTLARKHRQIIKSREIFLQRSSFEELFKAHFPKMRPDLYEYISAEEISSLATICRYFKVILRF